MRSSTHNSLPISSVSAYQRISYTGAAIVANLTFVSYGVAVAPGVTAAPPTWMLVSLKAVSVTTVSCVSR
jgi:hypothetical protein